MSVLRQLGSSGFCLLTLKIIPDEVAAITGCKTFDLRLAVIIPKQTADPVMRFDYCDSMVSVLMTAGDGGHYIQKLGERYKISDYKFVQFSVDSNRAHYPGDFVTQ